MVTAVAEVWCLLTVAVAVAERRLDQMWMLVSVQFGSLTLAFAQVIRIFSTASLFRSKLPERLRMLLGQCWLLLLLADLTQSNPDRSLCSLVGTCRERLFVLL